MQVGDSEHQRLGNYPGTPLLPISKSPIQESVPYWELIPEFPKVENIFAENLDEL